MAATFPFAQVPQNCRVLIYGAGQRGNNYLRQVLETGYCTVIGMIDENWRSFYNPPIPVYGIDDVKKISFDYIVIAIRDERIAAVAMQNLRSAAVATEKIIVPAIREIVFEPLKPIRKDGYHRAFMKKNCIPVALYLGGGIGDFIVRKIFFEELVKLSSKIRVDIYAGKTEQIAAIKAIYFGEKAVNEVIWDQDTYCEHYKRYSLSINLQNAPIVDFASLESLYAIGGHQLAQKVEKLSFYGKTYIKPGVENFVHYYRQMFLGQNYFTAYSCEGVFDIHRHFVRISLNPAYKAHYQDLQLKKYITVNYGNGSSVGDASPVNKQWPYEYFAEFVHLFKKEFPDMQIVQMGATECRAIDGVDHVILGESLELVKYILQGAFFHLDIEGGLVHLATQLKTRCIVLFGPTLEEFYGYPENINIRGGNCKGCWELYWPERPCAKKLSKPECMYAITPAMVMDYASKYLRQCLDCNIRQE